MEKEKFIKIRKYINDCKAKMVELETLLTSHPALAPENGGEGELEKAKALVDWLKKEGFAENQIQEIDAPDSRVKNGVRPNVIVTIPGESDDFAVAMSARYKIPSKLDEAFINHVPSNQRDNLSCSHPTINQRIRRIRNMERIYQVPEEIR